MKRRQKVLYWAVDWRHSSVFGRGTSTCEAISASLSTGRQKTVWSTGSMNLRDCIRSVGSVWRPGLRTGFRVLAAIFGGNQPGKKCDDGTGVAAKRTRIDPDDAPVYGRRTMRMAFVMLGAQSLNSIPSSDKVSLTTVDWVVAYRHGSWRGKQARFKTAETRLRRPLSQMTMPIPRTFCAIQLAGCISAAAE